MILIDRIVTLRSRSPCGERGLKSHNRLLSPLSAQSLPVRGAWIEMLFKQFTGDNTGVAPRAGSVD